MALPTHPSGSALEATPLDALLACSSTAGLRAALTELCKPFGELDRLEILTAGQGSRQALCFLRMHTPEQDRQLMQSWGIGRFGGDLVLVVSMAPAGSEFHDMQTSRH